LPTLLFSFDMVLFFRF